MKTTRKEMTTVSVGAEPRSGVPETNFNAISLPDPQAKSKNYFCLRKLKSERDCVGRVCNDGKSGSGSVSDLPTQPSQPTRDSTNPDTTATRLGKSLSLERQASRPAIRRTQLARGAAPDPGENCKTGEENER